MARRLGTQAGLALLLIFALTATTVMAMSVVAKNRNSSLEAFGLEVQRVEMGFSKAIEWYPRALRGLRGMFSASVSVEPEEFRLYVEDLFAGDLYPGIQAFSYVERVCGADPGSATSTDSVTGFMTADGCRAPSVSYDLEPGEHFIVKYGETAEGVSKTVGRDIGQIAARRDAMEKAAGTDSAVFSASTEILSKGSPGERGFVAYLPVYAKGASVETPEGRRAALVGFVSMSFETEAFFTGVFRQIGVDPELGIQIFDGVEGNGELLYSVGETYGLKSLDMAPQDGVAYVAQHSYSNFGRSWIFRSFAPRGFHLSVNEIREPYVWLILGVLLCAAILVVYRLVSDAEMAARKSAAVAASDRRLLELLMESLPVGVVISSTPAGSFATMNAAGRALLGREMDPSVDRDNYADRFDLVREDGTRYPKDELPLEKTLKTGRPASVSDVFVRRPDGSMRAMKLTSSVTRSEESGIAYVIMIGSDISREAALDKARVDFASLAAHQLKTPPVAIGWCVEMLADPDIGKLNRKQKEYAGRILDLSGRMRETVDALLVISRVEIGTFRIEPKPIDIAAMVETEVATFSEAAKRARINLAFEAPGRVLPKPVNDGRLIGMIVHNLVENAIRYTHKGGEVRVAVKRDDGSLTISVADTGIGIPSDQQSRVFERFFRADNAIGMSGEGSGLGLAVVKTIADRIGCRVSFESEEGKGTVFMVRVPIDGAFSVKTRKKSS